MCLSALLVTLQLMFSQVSYLPEVERFLYPCNPFLTTRTAQTAHGCCAGADPLKGVAITSPVKCMACNCVKQAARFNNFLQAKCSTTISFSVSRNIDCNTQVP
ncbi:hypothetical protein IFM89_023681 [Coptis chinensis]|uniref:Secreted protein n=1 Tax=Coptis chinensis TaxID=261450 RepID=A0A835LCG5_9MAGN|nr:hypothetical protein IFM89_023681 [Coptis chinensis]